MEGFRRYCPSRADKVFLLGRCKKERMNDRTVVTNQTERSRKWSIHVINTGLLKIKRAYCQRHIKSSLYYRLTQNDYENTVNV